MVWMPMNRRGFVQLGLATGLSIPAATVSSASTLHGGRPAFFFDPESAWARDIARRTQGHRPLPILGDPVRLWARHHRRQGESVSGVSCWSDFLIFQELAEDERMRLATNELLRQPSCRLLVRWTFVAHRLAEAPVG